MKLIVKSDDYGFTKGVTDGIVDGIKNGIIRNTGLFANMPSASYAVKRISEFKDVCLGIDINVVSGPCVTPKAKLPSLVDESGEFIRSSVKYKDPRYKKSSENEDLWPYEECYLEACSQIERFIDLVGYKPHYVTGHSISSNALAYLRAIRDAAFKYDILFAKDTLAKLDVKRVRDVTIKPFGIKAQLNSNPEKDALEQLEILKNEEYVMLSGHCGYVDDDLLKYSTYTIIRAKDHKMYTSNKIKRWIQENDVELITFDDLKAIVERK